MSSRAPVSILVLTGLLGCGGAGSTDDTTNLPEEETPEEEEVVGLSALGNGAHTTDAVSIRVVAGPDDDLDEPLDLAFNPRAPNQLWVVNYGSSTTSVLIDPGTDSQEVSRFRSTGSNHFLASPGALAFSDFGNWASAQDTDELTQGSATPRDFMGPVLWDDNLDKFDAGHGSHLDMLHNSPLGGGIAWDADNVYWYFDGYHGAITRYDFKSDHGYGGADHSDGEILRFVEGEVARVEGVPSHMELDRDSGLLYIADTDHSRIAVLDTATGDEGGSLRPNYDGVTQREVEDAELWTLVDGLNVDGVTMAMPSGLALYESHLYVGDHETGVILGFDLDGNLVDWLDSGRGSGALGGIDFDEAGNLWVTDISTSEILKIEAL